MSTSGIYTSLLVAAPTSTTTQAFTDTSTAAVALPTGAKRVYMYCDQLCHVAFGTSAVGAATTSSLPVAAGMPYVFDVKGGVTHFRVIRNTTTGTLWFSNVTG